MKYVTTSTSNGAGVAAGGATSTSNGTDAVTSTSIGKIWVSTGSNNISPQEYPTQTRANRKVHSLKYANKKSSRSSGKTSYVASKKLEDAKGLWPELLPEVLWAHHTTPKISTCETPYSLVYGTDAVIPVEVREPSLRYSNESGSSNDESRLQDLDEVEERRDMEHVRMVAQKQQAERYYNKKAKIQPLKVGDYIIKAKTQAVKDPNEGKLGTNWDEPYKITTALSKGAFQLETMEENHYKITGTSPT
uniref:Reverse transcriptase domain-containing protein n=1 Tax=Nicotiana tabacum TaxID=4097 RepID=A0A1S3XS94_TOBAC|nr:PREDICTED: uncharacterized protein LOC107768156 [Nicotiana tabacum]